MRGRILGRNWDKSLKSFFLLVFPHQQRASSTCSPWWIGRPGGWRPPPWSPWRPRTAWRHSYNLGSQVWCTIHPHFRSRPPVYLFPVGGPQQAAGDQAHADHQSWRMRSTCSLVELLPPWFELQISRLPGKCGYSTRPSGTTSSLVIWVES